MKSEVLVGAEAAAVASACDHLKDVARCAFTYGERQPGGYYGKLLREAEETLAERCRAYLKAVEARTLQGR